MSFLTYLALPLGKTGVSMGWMMVITYVIIAIPFVLSSIAICLALTRFAGRVSWLYAADLAGATSGCLVLVLALRLTDGPTAVIATAFFAALGSLLFAWGSGTAWLRLAAERSPALTPWLWGINGATSVCASVLAVAIGMTWGISTSFWAGLGSYVVAGLAFVVAARSLRVRGTASSDAPAAGKSD